MGGFGGGFSTAASQSLKNNRSMRRARGSYIKNRNREAHRYVVTKTNRNGYSSKWEMEQKLNQKLWKVWIIIGTVTMSLTWWLLQYINL